MDNLLWVKSSRSYDWKALKCLEVAKLPTGDVMIRNSRYPDGPTITYTRDEMAAFLEAARDGEFDHLVT